MTEPENRTANPVGPARFWHALIRGAIGILIVLGGVVLQSDGPQWVASIHNGLLASWTPGRLTPFMLAMLTVVASQSSNWRGTALACAAGLIAAVQYESGMIATALLMSHWDTAVPDGTLGRMLPALAGVAVALPVMIGAAILISRQTFRQRSWRGRDDGGVEGEAR